MQIAEERRARGGFNSLENFIARMPVGIEAVQILIYIGAFRFTGKAKNELILAARMLLVSSGAISREPLLFEESIKEYTLPVLVRDPYEDAFDEIELLSFPTSRSPFDLLQTKYRGSVMAKDLLSYHKREVKMLAYLVSIKHIPTKRGEMFFGTWIDCEGDYFDTAHFSTSLKKYPFKGGGCYLLLGMVEVDYHFPTITISRMEKMPFIPDPRYSDTPSKQYETQSQLREDVSVTNRAPYPQHHEIGLPRYRTVNSN